MIKKDLLSLCEDENIRRSLIVSTVEPEMDLADADELFSRSEKWITSLKSRDKSCLDTGIGIDTERFLGLFPYDAFFVNLAPFEKNVFAKSVKLSSFSDAVWIKQPVTFGKGVNEKVFADLQIATEQEHPVTFTYTAPEKKGEDLTYEGFFPRTIYETLDNNAVYLVGTLRDAQELLFLRMDRIRDIRVHEGEKMPPAREGLLDVLDYIWGADASVTEPVHVKVKIIKETKNIFDKIRTETNRRKYRKLYDDKDEVNVAWYEDEVCGLNSFKKWLRAYGASVIVYEPLSLAEEMYQSAQRRLERYEDLYKSEVFDKIT